MMLRSRACHSAAAATLLIVLLTRCQDASRPIPVAPEEVDVAAGPTPTPGPEHPSTPAPSGTPIVVVAAGDIVRCDRNGHELTAALLDDIPGTVIALGDNAYDTGALEDYDTCYSSSWGRHLARTRPTPGEREYATPDAAGYFAYFGGRAGPPDRGYYSYDLGDWHIIVLNSNLKTSATSPQVRWLRDDLQSNTRRCILAYWHHPRFYSSGSSGVRESLRPVWDALYEAGAAVVLNAHNRNYERFAPQAPDGAPDPARGIRQFIVGTGGASKASFGTVAPNSEVRDNSTYGVLKLTLEPTGYRWEFIPVAGGSFTDSGQGVCPGAEEDPPPSDGPPVAVPGGPYHGLEGDPIRFDGGGSSDPNGGTLTYAWDFGDGTHGVGRTPHHGFADDGAYTVTLTVTNAGGTSSAPAQTTATVSNVAPTVHAGPDATVGVGQSYALNASFTDPGAHDAPWTFTVDWGDGSPPHVGSVSTTASPIQTSHVYSTPGSYRLRVSVEDKDGGVGVDTLTVTVGDGGGAEPSVVLVAAGDIARCDKPNGERTAVLLDWIDGAIATLGDHVEPDAIPGSYDDCYGPSWGRHKGRTRPAVGNNDYYLGSADGYFNYWGERAGPRGKGYYSYDLGAWHIIVLNSNLSMARGSEQEAWLRADLAANTRRCILAYWHHPRFFTGSVNVNAAVKPIWDALYEAGAAVVLNAHRHQYERFAPQTPDGAVDPVRGIRQFIVGTGGAGKASLNNSIRAPNSEVLNNTAYGVLKLTLEPTGYSWEFISEAKVFFTDSGVGSCP